MTNIPKQTDGLLDALSDYIRRRDSVIQLVRVWCSVNGFPELQREVERVLLD